jgi:hypothetical protein
LLSLPSPSQVGKQFSRQELEQIASFPNFVFETNSFDALKSIQNELREKIFAIEGTKGLGFLFKHNLSIEMITTVVTIS